MLNHLIPLDIAFDPRAGFRFARFSNTSQTFLVSDLFWDYVCRQSSPPASFIDQLYQEAGRVEALGFGPPDSGPEVTPAPSRKQRFQEISLHLTHGCNLSCPYCNVRQGTYGDPFSRMDIDTARAAINFLLMPGIPDAEDRAPGDRETDNGEGMRLVLYGGEPLLNWPTLQAAVTTMRAAAPKSEIRLVTNGTLLIPERVEFLGEHDVFTIISLDGPPAVHDRNRPAVNGGTTYDQVLNGLNLIKTAGVRFHVRGTWLPGNEPYEEVLARLIDIVGDYRRVTLGLCFEEALGEGVKDYNQSLAKLLAAAGNDVRHFPSPALDCLNRVLWPGPEMPGGCDAGWTGVSVTPGGDIYPCQISVSRKDWRLGNVHDGLEADGREKWEQFAARVSPLCDSCWARPYCPGPCPYALPIPEQWSFCRTMKHQVREVLKFCGTVSSTDLLRTSLPPLTDTSLATALQRYLALRDILWTENKLIKPLAIGPWNREKR